MFPPSQILELVRHTIQQRYENEKDVPEQDRYFDLEQYETVLQWITELEPIPTYDTDSSVETHCTNPEPGDLFRERHADGSRGDWKLFLGGEMSDNWDFSMAYADPETGMFDGVHITHDSNTVDVVTLCRACNDQQATVDGEGEYNGTTISGPLCSDCAETPSE